MLIEREDQKEKPFEGLKIYYSGSIRGVQEMNPDFAWHLVQYMIEGGANVLSEHVAARNREEMEQIRAGKTGVTVEYLRNLPREEYVKDVVRKQDLEWVDEATHMIALVNAPSHGVGMEIQQAILKPRLGLALTPILCLIHENMFKNLSGMVTGVREEENPKFYVKTYKNLEEAKNIVRYFLTDEIMK